MRTFFAFIFYISSLGLYAQSDGPSKFIELETNKVLCLFSFLETMGGAPSASVSYRDYIMEALGEEQKFMDLVDEYQKINMSYHIDKKELPEKRKKYPTVKDFIWIASSNSSSINDLSQRIIGFLSNNDHAALIRILKEVEIYYDGLIWNQKQTEIARIEKQIEPYLPKIEDLFLKISKLYGTPWNQDIPFKIELYPIPLKRGHTTAIPKGNTLICSFLTDREDDYEGRLGVIVHEMCHIIFDEQPIEFQHQIDTWINVSDSKYSKLAYTYMDEGLATAVGNGWAYRELNGEIDGEQWYNDKYIDGFGHALFPLVDSYLKEDKTMDDKFVEQTIDLFAQEFPDAINDPGILLNEVKMFAIPESENAASQLVGIMQPYFQIRSLWLSTPINNEASIGAFHDEEVTKLFLIDREHTENWGLLKKHFKEIDDLEVKSEFIYAFEDGVSGSPVIILNVDGEDRFEAALQTLKARETLPFDMIVSIK